MRQLSFHPHLLVLTAWLLIDAAAGVCHADPPVALPAVPNERTEGRSLPVAANAVLASMQPRPLPAGTEAAVEIGVMSPEDRLIENFDLASLRKYSEKNGLVPIFEKGGPIMWPLLFASILALGTVLDRVFFLIGARSRRDKKGLRDFFTAIDKGDTEEALRIGRGSKYFVLRTLGYAMAHREKSLANALLYAQEQEMKRFRRGIPILDTVITLAPLLGLLGTVTGMMGSFALIGGELSAPGAITGGIAEALIATAFGLGIAITSLLPFNYLNSRMEEARLEIETAATQMEMAMHSRKDKPPVVKTIRPRPTVTEDAHAELAVAMYS